MIRQVMPLVITLLIIVSCEQSPSKPKEQISPISIEEEKEAILQTLNKETQAAFERRYEDWQSYWVHSPHITKVYLNFSDNSFSESIGWEEISQFVKDYFEEHPDPEPVPQALKEIHVEYYGTGAWVFYEQMDSLRGLKRETRLMQKVGKEWKIAGMQTTIYEFEKD